MIIKPRKHFPKRIVVIAAVIFALIVAGAVGAYMYMKPQPAPVSDNKYPPTAIRKPTDRLNVDPEEEDPAAHQHGIEGSKTSDESAGAAAFPTSQPNLVVEIKETKQSGSQLVIATSVSPKATGSCIIELTRTGQGSITKTVSLEAPESGSQCQNSNLDIALAARGEWTLTVKVQVASNVATATTPVTLK